MLLPIECQLLIIGNDSSCQILSQVLKNKFPDKPLKVVKDYEAGAAYLSIQKKTLIFAKPKIKECSLFDWVKSQSGKDFHWVVLAETLGDLPSTFEFGGSGYLKCPVKEEQVEAVLECLCRKIAGCKTEELSIVAENDQTITAHFQANNITVSYGEILYITSFGQVSIAYLNQPTEQKVPLSIPLKKAEKLLEPAGFFRVHRQYLINTRYIKNRGKLYKDKDPSSTKCYVRLNHGHKVEVSRRQRKIFEAYIQHNQFGE